MVGFDKCISAKDVGANRRMQSIGKMANVSDGINWDRAKANVVSKEVKSEIISVS